MYRKHINLSGHSFWYFFFSIPGVRKYANSTSSYVKIRHNIVVYIIVDDYEMIIAISSTILILDQRFDVRIQQHKIYYR